MRQVNPTQKRVRCPQTESPIRLHTGKPYYYNIKNRKIKG